MRRLRVFLFLLLSIGVSLQGYAYAALPKLYCPMERGAMTAMDAEAGHDCCAEAEMAAETGKACKPGQPCQSAGQFFPVSWLDVLPRNPLHSVRFPNPADIKISFDPAATWRPPALA